MIWNIKKKNCHGNRVNINNNSVIIYRRMDKEDIEAVASIERRSFTSPWSGKMFADEMQNPAAVYFVAEKSGIIIAYAGLWVIVDEGHITNIAVDPAWRGQHIADGLMRTIMGFAMERKLRGLTLEVRESNTAAISLYHKFGFVVEGRRKAYYRDEDALIMWRNFN